MIVISVLSVLIGCAPAQECPGCICPEPKGCEPCPTCELDLSKCPTIIETEEIESVQYVCKDGRVVNESEECVTQYVTPNMFSPRTSNEEGTAIEEVTIKPACQGINAGQVYFRVKSSPVNITFQLKEYGEENRDVYFIKRGVREAYKYFAICDKCGIADFDLKPGTIYLFRIRFDQSVVYKRIEYSNEHVIDLTKLSDYMANQC